MTREPLKHRPLWIAEGDLAVTGPPDDYTDQLRRAAHELFSGPQANAGPLNGATTRPRSGISMS
jgi:hypothetical protein